VASGEATAVKTATLAALAPRLTSSHHVGAVFFCNDPVVPMSAQQKSAIPVYDLEADASLGQREKTRGHASSA